MSSSHAHSQASAAADGHAVGVASGIPPAPVASRKVILVSHDRQWLHAYENGALVFDYAVETGRPELPTLTGTFTILFMTADTWFHSPWPKGGPHYYEY